MEVVAPYVKWQQPEVEEEEYVEQLLERRPKHRIATATSFDSEGGESGVSEVSDIGDRKLDTEAETEVGGGEIGNGVKDEEFGGIEEVEEVAGEGLSGKDTCLENVSGTKTNGTSEVQSRSTKVSVSEDGSITQSSEIIEESVTVQESQTITRIHHKAIKDAETEHYSSQSAQTNGSHQPSLDYAGNGDLHLINKNDQDYHIKSDNSDELGDLLEDDPEPIDYDVEGVLKKQETHDLICPHCNTCITRRVILRKRKRVINGVHHSAKRDKIEEADESEANPCDTARDTLDGNSADTLGHTADGRDDVITCWSCFSLLIPSGKGFKLFKVFGGRKQPEPVSLSDSSRTPLLTTDNREISVVDGNTVDSMQLGSGNTVNQKSTTSKKGGEWKLFNSYGNRRDDDFKSSHQMSTSQSSEVTTSSEKTFNAQGDTLSNHVEVNSKQTSSSSFYNNESLSVVTDYSTTHTQLAGKGQKSEASPGFQNGSSTILHSHDEYQIEINEKPGTEFDSLKDQISLNTEDIVSAVQGSTLFDKLVTDLGKGNITSRDDVRIPIENGIKQGVPSGTENVTRDTAIPVTETQAQGREQVARVTEPREWDILKSIVYGGLIESITSLGVVSSAAGAETSTLNILALGLANLVGGLILIFHNIKDLKNSAAEGPSNQVDRYYNSLGKRSNFKRHIVVAVLSFIIFGLIPIITYGFSFRESDNRDYKSLAVLGASIICITLLSIGKAHVKNPPPTASSYFNSIFYYLSIAISASGLSYVVGKLLQELIAKTGWFDTTSALNSIFPDTTTSSQLAWGSY